MRQELILDRQLLKVLKATAELEEIPVSKLLKRIIICAFEGRPAFPREMLKSINRFRTIYGLQTETIEFDGGQKRKR